MEKKYAGIFDHRISYLLFFPRVLFWIWFYYALCNLFSTVFNYPRKYLQTTDGFSTIAMISSKINEYQNKNFYCFYLLFSK